MMEVPLGKKSWSCGLLLQLCTFSLEVYAGSWAYSPASVRLPSTGYIVCNLTVWSTEEFFEFDLFIWTS